MVTAVIVKLRISISKFDYSELMQTAHQCKYFSVIKFVKMKFCLVLLVPSPSP